MADRNFLDFVMHHVVLTRKLPLSQESGTGEHEQKLLSLVYEEAKKFVTCINQEHIISWTPFLDALSSWRDFLAKESFHGHHIIDLLKDLPIGGKRFLDCDRTFTKR